MMHLKMTRVALLTTMVLCLSSWVYAADLSKSGTQWAPFLEWSLDNPTFSGNPYDLTASVTFLHQGSGETHTTEMFYDGGTTWKFRFTGTRTGTWVLTTSAVDSDLDNQTGTVTINANPDPNVHGFLKQFGEKWGWQGTEKAFVPQLVMYKAPFIFHNDPAQVGADIQTFIVEHGFNGFHLHAIALGWVDINKSGAIDKTSSKRDPDRKTFEAIEMLIKKTHAAGGYVHIWPWGDAQRDQTPTSIGGINGTADQRLQRYIAARLGPLPGWSIGYGFDLFEWTNASILMTWHDYMKQHLGWFHFLGARSNQNQLNQIYEGMDYSSYEQHKPDYNKYVETIDARPSKPSFSEDRFRIDTSISGKDYNEPLTRRGLYHSTMAGGVANIWGRLNNSPSPSGTPSKGKASGPYDHPEWIKTNSLFFKDRFVQDMVRDNAITDGVCLKRLTNRHYVFYKEDAASIQMDLSGMNGSQPAVAVDAKKVYAEISLGTLSASNQTWTAPYISDWVIAVGTIGTPQADSVPPAVPTGLIISPLD